MTLIYLFLCRGETTKPRSQDISLGVQATLHRSSCYKQYCLSLTNYCAIGSQMAPALYSAMLQVNNNQMASTPPTNMPLSVGVDLNIGDLSPMSISSIETVPLSATHSEGNPTIHYLHFSAIPNHQLRNLEDAITQHRNLVHEESAGAICQILA